MESSLDKEAVLSSLKELASERHQKIPQVLEDYLLHVARTGNVVFESEWDDVKRLLKLKLDCNIDYFQHFCSDLPSDKDFSLHQVRTFLYDRFDFFSRPPFTIQRLVEVLTTSRRQYRRVDKYLRAVEKNLMVVSTLGQEIEFHCETKFVPHFNYASPTVSKVGQADLIPLQNAAMNFDVPTRLSSRLYKHPLNPVIGDESDDEDEDEEMDEDSDVPFIHPALDGMDTAADPVGESCGLKNGLRKRKLRPEPSASMTITCCPSGSEVSQVQPVAMETEAEAATTALEIEKKETDVIAAKPEESAEMAEPVEKEEVKSLPEEVETKQPKEPVPEPEVAVDTPPQEEESTVLEKTSKPEEKSESMDQTPADLPEAAEQNHLEVEEPTKEEKAMESEEEESAKKAAIEVGAEEKVKEEQVPAAESVVCEMSSS